MAEKAIDALQKLHNESTIGSNQDKETWEAEFKQKVVIWFETQLSFFNAPLFKTFPEAKILQFTALLTGLKKYLPQNRRLEHFERYYNLLPPKEKKYAALPSSNNSQEKKIAEIKRLFSSAPGGIDSSSKELYYSAIAHLINKEKISLNDLVKQKVLIEDELLLLAPHLRYVDLTDFANTSVAVELIKNCLNLNSLSINESYTEKAIPPIPNCREALLQQLPPARSASRRAASLPDALLQQQPPARGASGCAALLPGASLLQQPPARGASSRAAPLRGAWLLQQPPARSASGRAALCRGALLLINSCSRRFQPRCPFARSFTATTAPARSASWSAAPLPDALLQQQPPARGASGCAALLPGSFAAPTTPCSRRFPAALPLCQWLNYEDCPLLQSRYAPEMPLTAQVYGGASQAHSARLRVDIEELKKHPKLFLLRLGEFLLNRKPFPNVDYYENGARSVAIDIGGVRRDFVSRLFEGVFLQQGRGIFTKSVIREKKGNGRLTTERKRQSSLYVQWVPFLPCAMQAPPIFKTGKLFPEVLFPLLKNSGLLPNDPLITEKQIKNFLLISGISEGVSDNILHLTKHQLSKEEIEKIPKDVRSQALEYIAFLLDPDRKLNAPLPHVEEANNRDRLREALLQKAREEHRLQALDLIAAAA